MGAMKISLKECCGTWRRRRIVEMNIEVEQELVV